MDKELEKKLAVISGQSPEEFDLSQLSDSDRSQIDYALDTLFQGLSLYNWLSGGSLGEAWKKSLSQIRTMVAEIARVNPAVKYLRQASFVYRTRKSDVILNSRNSNDLIQCPVESRKEWTARANAQIDEGITIIKNKIEEFDSGAPRSLVKKQQAQTMNLQRSLERERENERERTRN